MKATKYTPNIFRKNRMHITDTVEFHSAILPRHTFKKIICTQMQVDASVKSRNEFIKHSFLKAQTCPGKKTNKSQTIHWK